MKFLEIARYGVALALTATMPSVLLFWMLIHPLAKLWRRFHPGVVYGVTLGVFIIGMAVIASLRNRLLVTDWGTEPILIVLGAGFLGVSVWLRMLIGNAFTLSQLVGLPELAVQGTYPQAGLVTTGIYAQMRHPRYTQLIVASLGYAFFANYPAAYIVVAAFIPGIYFVALLEERELNERFGSAYADYARLVPRFIPTRLIFHDCKNSKTP